MSRVPVDPSTLHDVTTMAVDQWSTDVGTSEKTTVADAGALTTASAEEQSTVGTTAGSEEQSTVGTLPVLKSSRQWSPLLVLKSSRQWAPLLVLKSSRQWRPLLILKSSPTVADGISAAAIQSLEDTVWYLGRISIDSSRN